MIQSSPEAVWRVLMDFPSHAEWDPFLRSLEGQPRVGERIEVRFRNGFTMRPRITVLEDARVFEWQGKLAFGGLFDGRHRFELVAEGDGTRLVHSECFTGLLVPFMGRTIEEARGGFEALNLALRSRVEGREADPAWQESAA